MERNLLVENIVDEEYRMFMTVKTDEEPSCREDSDGFRLNRKAQFSAWSEATLESYLSDLNKAKTSGRNLMTYKYARMDELIPSENNSVLIKKIAEAQMIWQKEIFIKYPKLMKNARGLKDGDESDLDVSFERYLKAELESYSENTLELLYKDVQSFINEDRNMTEIVYENLVSAYGYDSLENFS